MKLLDGAKAALYGLFLNYYCYYVLTGSFIPRGTVLFLALALMCVGVDVLRQRFIHVGREITCWLLYAAVSFVTTVLILGSSGDMGFISDIIKYVQRTAIIMMVAYICQREGSIRFGLRLMAVTAVALAVAVLSVTGNYRLKLDITSGADLSANDTGAILSFGCFAVLYAWGRRKQTSLVLSALKTAGVICCITVIFLAGSRKSIGAVLVMAAVMLVLCFRDYSSTITLKKFAVLVVIGAAAYWFVSKNLMPLAEQTNLYDRLFGDNAVGAAQSDEGRLRLIRYALEDFRAHPLLGLGFNQYVEHHGNYTHCTYVEPLACSGLVGLLYLYPYYLIVKKQIYLILRNPPGSYARLKQKEMFVYLCMFLFVAVGIPYMYKDAPCIILGTFVAHQSLSLRELGERGRSSGEY